MKRRNWIKTGLAAASALVGSRPVFARSKPKESTRVDPEKDKAALRVDYGQEVRPIFVGGDSEPPMWVTGYRHLRLQCVIGDNDWQYLACWENLDNPVEMATAKNFIRHTLPTWPCELPEGTIEMLVAWVEDQPEKDGRISDDKLFCWSRVERRYVDGRHADTTVYYEAAPRFEKPVERINCTLNIE